jgi:GntR family transcriptional regulator
MHTQVQTVLDALRVEDTGVPIYVQLREQLLRAIGAGVLQPGDQMPTMRQVAVALRVDLNTVRHAYDDLERRGVIDLVRGRGSFVARTPPAMDDKTKARKGEDLAKQTLAAAAALGIDPTELARRLIELNRTKGAEQ